MFLSQQKSKKLIFSTLMSLGAAVMFVVNPIFAQTSSPTTSAAQTQTGSQGIADDFDNDVKQGKDELLKDPEARIHQKEVVDGEDEIAGNEEEDDINEYTTIQEADDDQGENEENVDIYNSEVEEVDDADELDVESQNIINEHQVQEEGEIEEVETENEQQGGAGIIEQGTSSQENPEQSQPE